MTTWMNPRTICSALSLVALLAACGSREPEQVDTQSTGNARFADAETDDSGAARPPARPAPQPRSDPRWVEIRFEGTGALELSEPGCDPTNLTGAFEGLYQGEATLDDDGVYVASFAEAEAEVVTPSGCEVPGLSIDLITGVEVYSTLSATRENCETYCTAKARAHAEEACSADSSEAECRAEVAAEYAAACQTTCTRSTTYTIVASTSLGASALADLTADALTGAALGTIEADLTFDHIEDEQGETVSEAP